MEYRTQSEFLSTVKPVIKQSEIISKVLPSPAQEIIPQKENPILSDSSRTNEEAHVNELQTDRKLYNIENEVLNEKTALENNNNNAVADTESPITSIQVEKLNSFEPEVSPYEGYNLSTIIFLTVNASAGYFFFGYILAVYNTTKANMMYNLGVENMSKDFVYSLASALVDCGAVIGCFCGGPLTRYFGRRKFFIILDVISLATCILFAIPYLISFCIFRVISGFCFGCYCVVVGIYVYEYVPVNMVGICGGIYTTIGASASLICYFLGLNLPATGVEDLYWWRLMFCFFPGIPILFNLIMLLTLFTKETPVYLVSIGEIDEALEAIKIIYTDPNLAKQKIDHLVKLEKENEDKEKVSYHAIFCTERFQKRTFICSIINVSKNIVLVNVIAGFSNLIFQKTFDQATATQYTVYTGISHFVATAIAGILVTKLGTKPLIAGGFCIVWLLLDQMSFER